MNAFLFRSGFCLAWLSMACLSRSAFGHGDAPAPHLGFRAMNNIYAYEPRDGKPATPVRFVIERGGETFAQQAKSLTFYLEYWGTADTNDYEPLPRQITLPGGVSSYSVEVRPRADRLAEGTESIQARIVPPLPFYEAEDGTRKPCGGAFASVSAMIVDADGPATGSVFRIAADMPEVREPATNYPPVEARFTVSRTEAAAPVHVRLAYAGTAGAADYRAGETNLFFAAGVSSRTVTVAVNGDALVENEFVIARILPWRTEFGAERYLISPSLHAATIRILDRPVPPSSSQTPLGRSIFSIQVLSGTAAEPGVDFEAFPAIVRVARTGERRSGLTVKINVDGTAKAPDYFMELTNGMRRVENSIYFAPGDAEEDIAIRPRADAEAELDETVSIELLASESYGLELDARRGMVVIHDSGGPLASTAALIISEPEEGAYLSGDEVDIRTVLDDAGGRLERIEFFDADERIGELPIDSHAGVLEQVFRWRRVPNGRRTIQARAFDAAGAILASQEVQFTIANELAWPLRISALSRNTGGVLRLQVSGEPGLYQMQSSPDLRVWSRKAAVELQQGTAAGPEIVAGRSNEFFRVVRE